MIRDSNEEVVDCGATCWVFGCNSSNAQTPSANVFSCEFQRADGRHTCVDYNLGFVAEGIAPACSSPQGGTFREAPCDPSGAIAYCLTDVPDPDAPVQATEWVYADPEGKAAKNCQGANLTWVDNGALAECAICICRMGSDWRVVKRNCSRADCKYECRYYDESVCQ